MVAWVFSFDFAAKWSRLKANKSAWPILGLFILSIQGMSYTTNPVEGWKDVVMKLPLVLIPLAYSTIPKISPKRIKTLLLTFASVTAFGVILSIINAYLKYQDDGQASHFFYHAFVMFKMAPLHYFAMYCTFSIFIFLYYLKKERLQSIQIALVVLATLTLFTGIFLCAVRIQFAVLALTLPVYIFWLYYEKGSVLKPLSIVLGFSIGFSILAFLIPSSKRRIIETYQEWSVYRGTNKEKQTNHRVFIWSDGVKVIQEHFWIGTGTGCANDYLYERIRHQKAKFWDGKGVYTLAKSKYNYHNALLQHFAAHGIMGALVLMATFLVPLFTHRGKRSFLAYLLLLITAVSFVTESMLERQAGNMFFGFMFSLMILNARDLCLSDHEELTDKA